MKRTTIRLAAVAMFFVFRCLTSSLFAQSLDASAPAPLSSPDVTGRIVPLDVGDPRFTKHYYIFRAGPGDLILNVESTNLNGDVDLFTAVSLQPLLKVSMYAASSADGSTKTSKSVFLRRAESIIMRIEARTVGDLEGQYHLTLTGPFEALAQTTSRANEENSSDKPPVRNTRSGNTRRVNSIGARIEEPPAETPAPNTTIAKTGIATAKTSRPVKPAPEAARETSAAEPTPPAPSARPVRRRPLPRSRSTAARRRTTPPVSNAPPETVARGRESGPQTEVDEPPAAPIAVTRRIPPAASQNSVPVLSARLIIEMRDGEKIERPMSEVRRLTVERGVLIVITNTGSLERRPMSTVLKVSIEP